MGGVAECQFWPGCGHQGYSSECNEAERHAELKAKHLGAGMNLDLKSEHSVKTTVIRQHTIKLPLSEVVKQLKLPPGATLRLDVPGSPHSHHELIPLSVNGIIIATWSTHEDVVGAVADTT